MYIFLDDHRGAYLSALVRNQLCTSPAGRRDMVDGYARLLCCGGRRRDGNAASSQLARRRSSGECTRLSKRRLALFETDAEWEAQSSQ
eukprot:879312-Pleurochrysis_carterae.AAC.3